MFPTRKINDFGMDLFSSPIWSYSKRKEFVAIGSKFFPLREVPILSYFKYKGGKSLSANGVGFCKMAVEW